MSVGDSYNTLCGHLGPISPRMSCSLTLLTLSLMNPLPSGALMLTGMMGFERHERIGCGWDGTAWVTHSAPPMDGPSSGWRMIRCAMDGGWWTGAGRDGVVWDGHGWMVCSLSRSLTLPSLVSRDGWDGHGPQYVSLGVPPHPTTTCIARTTHHACTCLPRVIHPQCMHDHKGHVATSPSHHHGCPVH